MKELIYPPLIINMMMFVVGSVMGINPSLVTISNPGGFVYQVQITVMVTSLIGIGIALAFIGVKILGSGLSDSSVSIINRAVIYSITWLILSSVTYAFLYAIPTFGGIIYGVLSLLYGFGVFLSLSEIGGGGSGAGKEGSGGETE